MQGSGVGPIAFWPVWVYWAAVVTVVSAIVGISYVLGQHSRNLSKSTPYESGILSTGSAHVRFSAGFFLVAIFFVIFDLESVFIVAWAIAAPELGWPGYAALCTFVLAVVAALAYLWREGALES